MKLLVASDIHGSSYYCKKLIERIEIEKVDKIILLGDILYHGPRNNLPKEYDPKKVIEMLNSLDKTIVSIKGNCDSEVDQMVLTFPIQADYAFVLKDDYVIYLSHGHKSLDNLNLKTGDVVINGHTHIQKCEKRTINNQTYLYMNCGSVSIPKENGFNGYMIIDNDEYLWKDLDGTIKMKYLNK